MREQRALSSSTGVLPACLLDGSGESSALSQAVLASGLSKEGLGASGLEGNKEDAGSLGQLLLVVLSWLLKSSSCVAMHTASPASSCRIEAG